MEIKKSGDLDENPLKMADYVQYCLNPILFCLKPIIFCLKPIIFCLKPIVFCLKPIIFCLKPIVFCLKQKSVRKSSRNLRVLTIHRLGILAGRLPANWYSKDCLLVSLLAR